MFSLLRNAAVLVVMCGTALSAQTASSLSVASGTGCPGTVVSIPIALGGGANPAGVQWDLTYPSADLVAQTVTLGSAPAGKTIDCVESSGATTWATCLIYGIDQNFIPNGTVADVLFEIQAGTSASSVPIQPANLFAVAPTGGSVPVSGTGGTVTVVPCGGCPTDLVLANQTITGPQTLQATATATLGSSLVINGDNVVVNAPIVAMLADTEVSGAFSAGNNPSCP